MATSLPSLVIVAAPHLGQLLTVTRKRHKLTQAAVASRVGLSQNRLSHLERHPEEISFKQLLSWCSVLELQLRLEERYIASPEDLAEW